METFILWCRSGKRYFVNSFTSSTAVHNLETLFGERVFSWERADEIPSGATVLNFAPNVALN